MSRDGAEGCGNDMADDPVVSCRSRAVDRPSTDSRRARSANDVSSDAVISTFDDQAGERVGDVSVEQNEENRL